MINSLKIQKNMTRFVVVRFVSAILLAVSLGTTAIAEDIYGTYSLEEEEFATVSGKKRTMNIPTWKPNAEKNAMAPCDVSENDSKTFGVFQMFTREDMQVTGRKEMLVPKWRQKPETPQSLTFDSEKSEDRKAPAHVAHNLEDLNKTKCIETVNKSSR
jgi:hypothetical protein